MCALENFIYTFGKQLINVINPNPMDISRDILMPNYNQFLMDTVTQHS